jgi:hypothetical protein
MRSPIQQLETLREHRGTRERDASISNVIAGTAQHATRTHRKLGQLIARWEELLPPDLTSHTSLGGLRNGVLHVVVDSSSAAYELDRLLRGGLEKQLQQRFRGSLARIRVRIGPLNGPVS